MARQRDYSAEYRRRNELAQQRGFKNYGQQRRYTEYTGESARYIYSPPEPIYIPRYDYGDYNVGEDTNLDVFLRYARYHGMDEEEAYDKYMRKFHGRGSTRTQVRDFESELFDVEYDDTWY